MIHILFVANGRKYGIPGSIIAKNRAEYYEDREPGCYSGEYDYAMVNHDELVDWLRNNMNYSDVEAYLVDYGRVLGKTLEDCFTDAMSEGLYELTEDEPNRV